MYHSPGTAKKEQSKQGDGHPPLKSTSAADFNQSMGGPNGSDGDCDMEEVTSSNAKLVLAWEIDTTDFDAVLTRKMRASKRNHT